MDRDSETGEDAEIGEDSEMDEISETLSTTLSTARADAYRTVKER